MKIPFTPVVCEHAARFVGRSPWAVSRDPELMFEGHRLAYLEYRHQVICLGIDIYNLEAEANGATIENTGEVGIPAVHAPLLHSLDEGLALPPYDPARAGRIAMLLAVGRRLKREFPEARSFPRPTSASPSPARSPSPSTCAASPTSART